MTVSRERFSKAAWFAIQRLVEQRWLLPDDGRALRSAERTKALAHVSRLDELLGHGRAGRAARAELAALRELLGKEPEHRSPTRRRVHIENSEGRRLLIGALATRGVTQKIVAARLGIKRSTLANWANGRRSPDFAGRVALAREFGLAMDAFDRESTAKVAHETRGASTLSPESAKHCAA